MVAQRIVLRVYLHGNKDKQKVLKVVSNLDGVDSLSVDMRDEKITVVGSGLDAINIVCNLRKLFGVADIVSVEEVKYSAIVEEFPLEFLNLITNNFSEDRIIGRSRYGAIYKGVRDNGKCIAVMKLLHLKPMLKEEFKHEICRLAGVQHVNTIQLVGYCHHIAQVSVDHKGESVSARVRERAICFEYLQEPSLDEYLSNKPCRLHWHTCYAIIRGICKGLHYLHKGSEHPIYHLYLQPTNILLDSLYMPPEYIKRHEISPKFDGFFFRKEKFDVFSLGVIIIQIMAGKESYYTCTDTSPEEFIQLVHEFWAQRMPETVWRQTSCEVEACIGIALKCVKSDLVMRPTITEVLDELDMNEIYTADQLYYRTSNFTLNFLVLKNVFKLRLISIKH